MSVSGCSLEPKLHYYCPEHALDLTDLCHRKNYGRCEFELLHLRYHNSCITRYTVFDCLCVNSICDYVIVNNWFYFLAYLYYINKRFSYISVMVGCNFEFIIPKVSIVKISSKFELFENVTPVPIGINVALIQKLLIYSDLQKNAMKKCNKHAK